MIKNFDVSRRPNIIPWPPIILGLSLLGSIVLSAVAPLHIVASGLANLLIIPGIILIATGIFLDIWALATMFWKSTNIRPDKAADKLVTSGPFSFSRNPIYLGNTIALFGVGLGFNHFWFMVMSLVHAGAVYILAIKREEAHLASRFGSEWENYRKRVPRWIGPVRKPDQTVNT